MTLKEELKQHLLCEIAHDGVHRPGGAGMWFANQPEWCAIRALAELIHDGLIEDREDHMGRCTFHITRAGLSAAALALLKVTERESR